MVLSVFHTRFSKSFNFFCYFFVNFACFGMVLSVFCTYFVSPTLILRELSVLCRPSESERCGESAAVEYEVRRQMENGVVEFCSL